MSDDKPYVYFSSSDSCTSPTTGTISFDSEGTTADSLILDQPSEPGPSNIEPPVCHEENPAGTETIETNLGWSYQASPREGSSQGHLFVEPQGAYSRLTPPTSRLFPGPLTSSGPKAKSKFSFGIRPLMDRMKEKSPEKKQFLQEKETKSLLSPDSSETSSETAPPQPIEKKRKSEELKERCSSLTVQLRTETQRVSPSKISEERERTQSEGQVRHLKTDPENSKTQKKSPLKIFGFKKTKEATKSPKSGSSRGRSESAPPQPIQPTQEEGKSTELKERSFSLAGHSQPETQCVSPRKDSEERPRVQSEGQFGPLQTDPENKSKKKSPLKMFGFKKTKEATKSMKSGSSGSSENAPLQPIQPTLEEMSELKERSSSLSGHSQPETRVSPSKIFKERLRRKSEGQIYHLKTDPEPSKPKKKSPMKKFVHIFKKESKNIDTEVEPDLEKRTASVHISKTADVKEPSGKPDDHDVAEASTSAAGASGAEALEEDSDQKEESPNAVPRRLRRQRSESESDVSDSPSKRKASGE